MKHLIALSLLAAGLSLAACSQQKPAPKAESTALATNTVAEGDSTLYGLACDGSTDSVLVVLPYTGGDPDTLDIINAFHERRIYGRPHIGDELAIILNPEDKEEALMVINLETLKGQWCYMVEPTLRSIENMPQRIQRRMLANMPDSVKERLMVPREYTLQLKRGHVAQTMGAGRRQTTTDDMSPVEYPALKRYTEWHIYNGQLILTAGSRGIGDDKAQKKQPENDTVTLQLLRSDSLVLRFSDHVQSYYRKRNTTAAR